MTLKTYGFIGCGSLGGPLAANLAKAGFVVLVTDRRREAAEAALAAGASWRDEPRAVAADADAVITCLPSPTVSEAVLQTMLDGFSERARGEPPIWIEMSTLGQDDMLRLAATAQARGVEVLELPVTGGVHLAARGALTLLAGGDAALIERLRPALDVLGARLFHIGPIGAASLIKVITNMLAFIHLAATSEAMMLAKRGGLDLGQAWAAIAASSGNSFVHETEGQLILNGSYDVAFSIDLALKDLGFAREFGRRFETPLDLAALVEQIYVRARAAYGGEAQSPMIAKLLEDLLDTPLRADGFPPRLT